jgi:preprotein translocase SecE subunit
MNANYLKEVVRELKLSTFPTQNTVLNFTIFVILFTAAVAVYLGALDVVFGKGTVSGIEILRSSEVLAPYRADVNNILEVASTTIDIATSTATSTN